MTSRGLKVLLTGGSGMVGKAFRTSMGTASITNHFAPDILQLVRHEPQNPNEFYWNPYEGYIDRRLADVLPDVDAVVHLAGENIGSGEGMLAATGRWTERKMHMIMESRRRGTQLLVKAMRAADTPPPTLVMASGIGYYGDRGDEIVGETEPKGDTFLAEVSHTAERESKRAVDLGMRVVNLRLGVVLSRNGGAMEKLIPPFSFGLGGPIGAGTQYMSWVSLVDAVRIIEHAITRPDLSGAVNAVAPTPVTSNEFAKSLGSALHRPAVIPMPEQAVKTIFGQMGEETLLASTRGSADKLLESGFRFKHPTISEGLESALQGRGGLEELAGDMAR